MESMETLTKADLSKHLMEQLEFGKKDADLLVNTFLDCVIKALHRVRAWNCAASEASACATAGRGRAAIPEAVSPSRCPPSGSCISSSARN